MKFQPHKAITRGLPYKTHENGHLLTIRYAVEEDWSKDFRDKTIAGVGTDTVADRVIRRIGEVLDGQDFVWMANKDAPDSIFGHRGHRLPNSLHGLNYYQHIHHAVILSALNPPPAHFSFLDALGFNSREVKRAGYWQAVYQALMRASPRNPDDPTRRRPLLWIEPQPSGWPPCFPAVQ